MDAKTAKYQTIANAEEQHLAAMSTTSSSATSTTTVKSSTSKTKKVTKKTALKATMSQSIEETYSSAIGQQQQQQQQIEEQSGTNVAQQKSKAGRKKIAAAATTTTTTATATATTETTTAARKEQLEETQQKHAREENVPESTSGVGATTCSSTSNGAVNGNANANANANASGKKKLKTKKSKKGEHEKQNISVKSSFSKFDALQKRHLIHVRSSDADKAQEIFSINPQGEKESNCRLCSKPVYKMEEIKAERSIFHKNCFRCHECNKPLKVDNYQSHEGVLYCLMHFKLLLAPKCVEDAEPEKPRKPEMIIRENQPVELPPDVVRASDKPDLGLEELQQLNVRSRFQVFENAPQPKPEEEAGVARGTPVKRSTSILSKLAKLQALGFSTDLSAHDIAAHAGGDSSDDGSNEDGSDSEHTGGDDDDDMDLVRSKKRTQRERPVGLGNAMHDIKTKFEKGHIMSKEERREERKQEIQNIRSRLFMGKQARIKEMYQQAVADSEQSITAAGKKQDFEIDGVAARSIKERFEKGEMFKEAASDSDEPNHHHQHRTSGIQDEADVFESGISKKSRSIFMELDANVAAGKNQIPITPTPPTNGLQKNRSAVFNRFNSENEQENVSNTAERDANTDVVKYDERPEDVKIETSEISSKFKFFETYRPSECKRKEFRMTPPREGEAGKVATPEDAELERQSTAERQATNGDASILKKSQTTALMLNKFREMEQNKNGGERTAGPRPLKCFTPPPDGGRRLYQDQDSDAGSQDDDDEDDEDDEDDDDEEEDEEDASEEEQRYRRSKLHMDDEALIEAQAAARAKQLRAKFEKWEANEVQRELHEGRIDIYSDQVSDDTNIESTKSIRDRFENMKNSGRKSPTKPRYQVNRFV